MNDQPAELGTDPVEPTVEEVKAWADILSDIPSDFVPVIEPKVQKFYEEQESRYNELNSKYEPYTAFEKDGVNAEDLQKALTFSSWVAQDPEAALKALADQLGYDFDENGDADNVDDGDDDDDDDEDVDPRILELQAKLEQQGEVLQQFSQLELTKSQMAQEAKQQAELDVYLSSLKEKEPDFFDEEMVLSFLANGRTGEEAIAKAKSFAEAAMNAAPSTAPRVLGSGSLPSNQRPVTELTNSEVTDLVVQMAQRAAQENK